MNLKKGNSKSVVKSVNTAKKISKGIVKHNLNAGRKVTKPK